MQIYFLFQIDEQLNVEYYANVLQNVLEYYANNPVLYTW